MMFQGEEIQGLINLLNSRRVLLYHACQYIDFLSYLNLGKVPSRAYLQSNESSFTSFETDSVDQQNQVWDKVFVNLSDFGTTFANRGPAVPNPYGPILFQLHPAVLVEANDVAVCLRSAGTEGFDRVRESLSSLDEINRLFKKPVTDPYPGNTWVKVGNDLQQEFDDATAKSPEVSCTVNGGGFTLSQVVNISVDPYLIGNKPLYSIVGKALRNSGHQIGISRRITKIDPAIYNELSRIIATSIPPLMELCTANVSTYIQKWSQRLIDRDLEYQFIRFASYLNQGTMTPLREQLG